LQRNNISKDEVFNMSTIYLEVGASESGDGSAGNPFHVDGQTALDDILDGSYTNASAAQSGDVYVFKAGTYASGLRINADGHDGLTFRGEGTHAAYFPLVQLGPIGDLTSNILTRSSETTTFSNLNLQPSSAFRAGGGTLAIVDCLIDAAVSGGYATFQMGGYAPGSTPDGWLRSSISFLRCLVINGTADLFQRRNTNHTYTNAKDLPSPLTIDFCTFILRDQEPFSQGASGASFAANINNSIFYGEDGVTSDSNNYNSFPESANNWAYQTGGSRLSGISIATTDPLFIDPAVDNYRLRPSDAGPIGLGV